jgi:hypothetical protein
VIQYVRDSLDRLTEEQWRDGATPPGAVVVTTTTPGGPVNEVQRVGFTATLITGGTFRLTFGQEATPPLLNQHPPRLVVAALGDRPAIPLVGRLSRAGDQAQIGGRLLGRPKPFDVPQRGQHRFGYHHVHAGQRPRQTHALVLPGPPRTPRSTGAPRDTVPTALLLVIPGTTECIACKIWSVAGWRP